MREAVPVGTGRRASGVTNHDEYSLGQFKDDQLQAVRSPIYMTMGSSAPRQMGCDRPYEASSGSALFWRLRYDIYDSNYLPYANFAGSGANFTAFGEACSDAAGYTDWSTSYHRYGKSTRTKQAGVNFIIKF